MSGLQQRTATGAALVAGLCVILLIGSPLVECFICAVSVLGLYEYFSMFEARPSSRTLDICIGAVLILLTYAAGISLGSLLLGQFAFVAYLFVNLLLIKDVSLDEELPRLVLKAFGYFYAGILPCALLLLFQHNHGTALLCFLFAVVAAADTGAYFAGMKFGKHKLHPLVSPGKSVEGLVGGLAAGTLVCMVSSATWLDGLGVRIKFSFLVGICLVLISVVGDLAESILKRVAKVKDSSNLLPGHGGVLDRLDSIIFAAPVLYAFLLLWS